MVAADEDGSQHLITYPISSGRILNVGAGVSFPGKEGVPYEGPWTRPVGREEIVKYFQGWEPDVHEVLKVSKVRTSSYDIALISLNSTSTEASCGLFMSPASYRPILTDGLRSWVML